MTINNTVNITMMFVMALILFNGENVRAESDDFGTFSPYPEGGSMQVVVEPEQNEYQNEYTGANDFGYDSLSIVPFGEGFMTTNIIESV